MKTETNNSVAVAELQTVAATPITKEIATSVLIRLFMALETATGNAGIALDVIGKIADGIESDPDFSAKILTPDNIAKVYELKAKSDSGKVKLSDIESAFPALVESIPFWSMIKTFIPKNAQ